MFRPNLTWIKWCWLRQVPAIVQPDCEELSMAEDNYRALWDYRIKHFLRARPESSPDAKNKLVNSSVPLMNSLFGSPFKEWNADKGSDCKLSKWLIQPLIKIFSFLASLLLPFFFFWFFLGLKSCRFFLRVLSPIPHPYSQKQIRFLTSYTPLIIPWKDLKDIKWSCLPTGIQKKQQEFGQHTNISQCWATLPKISSLSRTQWLWRVWELGLLQHSWFTDV